LEKKMKLFAEIDKHTGYIENHRPWLTGTLCAVCLLLFLILGAAPEALLYSRAAIAQGEIWRLLTGHFVHCDFAHLAWNLLPLLLIGGLLEQRIGWMKFSGVTAVSCLGVSGWLWFTQIDLQLYCGLSGMLNGLLVVLLATLWQESRHPVLSLIGLVALAKIIFETTNQEAIFTHLSWAGLPGAHGAGMATGIAYLVVAAVVHNRPFLCKKGDRSAIQGVPGIVSG
jgi:rhomboid family GlyGly-CTERM serine protease